MLVHRLPIEETALRSLPRDRRSVDAERPRRLNLKHAALALAVFEMSGVACAGIMRGTLAPTWQAYALVAGLPTMVFLLLAHVTGLYRPALLTSASGPGLGCLVPMGVAFAAEVWPLPGAQTQDWRAAALWAGCAALWSGLARTVWLSTLRLLLRAGGCVECALVLAETLSVARSIGAELERRTGGRMRACASLPLPGMPGAASLAWLERTIDAWDIGKVVIVEPPGGLPAESRQALGLVRFCPDVVVLPELGAPYRVTALDCQLPDLRTPRQPLSPTQVAVKRVTDLIIASVALLPALPLMLMVAAAIKIDSPGPILFSQDRKGLNGRIFRIWKFRTMHHDLQDKAATIQTARQDRRVTRIGRFLRKSSLDELPQLLNVLNGDMSIVGPRPHALGMRIAGSTLEALVDGYDARHAVKPGITGWAQVNGCRGELATKRALLRRLALDSHYIRFWSLRMDIEIILRTVAIIFADRHAY